MARKLYADKTYVIEDICKTLNIIRATLYRYISGAGSPTASRSRN
jgi:Helix-turn-helix domain of resolvase